jgi:sugar lactone lactonase YvrE
LHHIVKKFDNRGHFIRQCGSHGIGDGEFDHPKEIATFSGNSLLVVDSDNHRIQEFSRDGVFITSPRGVAINKINDIHYLFDTGNNRIQRFHQDVAVC